MHVYTKIVFFVYELAVIVNGRHVCLFSLVVLPNNIKKD